MVSSLTPLENALACVRAGQNFLVQGGAGSGKTETLSQLIQAITHARPQTKIACITHTNKAAGEIAARIGNGHYVGTIHAFLNTIVGKYKKNIHKHIWRLFEVPEMFRLPDTHYPDKKTQNLAEHDRFKKTYEKYASLNFTVNHIRLGKPIGKKDYDASPDSYNDELNTAIRTFNDDIRRKIWAKGFSTIEYNDTRFNSFERLTYGHDGLLAIAALLFAEYPVLRKILTDKFDCIFVDEFQDTDPKIVTTLLELPKGKTTVGFFGDSMQAIYSQGTGNVDALVLSGELIKIEKDDNYRCAEQIIKLINTLRYDGLSQSVAFKNIEGIPEVLADRQGKVSFYFAVYENKPNSRSPQDEKERYERALNFLTNAAAFNDQCKTLLLSNKAISAKAGFATVYQIFSDRYSEPNEEIEKMLMRLQILDLFEICEAYRKREYNRILTTLKKSGIVITKISDKKNIAEAIEKISSYEGNALTAVKLAVDLGLLAESESFREYTSRIDSTLNELLIDSELIAFEEKYLDDGHTYLKMFKKDPSIDEEYFNEHKRALAQRDFYKSIVSDSFTFQEVSAYCKYQDEQTQFVTMHKTKGTGIPNVLVVLDEYFWVEYDFRAVFDSSEPNRAKREKNQRLVYVACSRAQNNLRCARLVSNEEKSLFLKAFEFAEIVEVQLPAD